MITLFVGIVVLVSLVTFTALLLAFVIIMPFKLGYWSFRLVRYIQRKRQTAAHCQRAKSYIAES